MTFTIMKLAAELADALDKVTYAESVAAAEQVLSNHRLGIMRLLSDSDYPETETVRVNVTERDRAAYKLAALAWPGEAEDHRQRWYRRIVFEPDQLASVVQSANAHGADPDELHALIRIVSEPEPGSPLALDNT